MTFSIKAQPGTPVTVKEFAEKLRAIAGLDSISEGSSAVYFTMSGEETAESAADTARGMIRFAGIWHRGLRVGPV